MKVMRLGHLPLALRSRTELTTVNAADKAIARWLPHFCAVPVVPSAAVYRQDNNALMSAAAQGHISVVTTLVQEVASA